MCVSVSDGSGAGLDCSDVRPSYFTEPRTPQRMFENSGLGCKRNRGAAVEADAIGEQQLKRTQAASMQQQLKRAQSGSSSWKRTQTGSSSAVAIGPRSSSWFEADASGEQQLKWTQSGGKRTQSGSSSSAQRAVRRRITHGRRTRGK